MPQFQRIKPDAAKEKMDQNAQVVDIRDELSFRHGHIRSARHLDNQSLASFVQESDFEQPVIVCCYHGNSSQPAAQVLVEQGFKEVYSLDGGYEVWRQLYPEDCTAGLESSEGLK